MHNTIFATFADAQDAEKAAGALLDFGVRDTDLTLVRHYVGSPTDSAEDQLKEQFSADHAAKGGLSTTTGGDAAIGAEKGAAWGLGLGTLAALAALFIPGVGLVIGGGAMAAAIGASAAATGAGAVAGAVTGYLRDQGYQESEINRYDEVVRGGGAVLTVTVPSGDVDEPKVWEIVDKYQGEPLRQVVLGDTPYVS